MNFGGDKAIGGEDADFTNGTSIIGRSSEVRPRVITFIILPKITLFVKYYRVKKCMRSLGRFLRKSPLQDKKASMIFLAKPMLAMVGLTPGVGWVLLIVFALVYTPKMFMSSATLRDSRIFLIPLVNVFLYAMKRGGSEKGFLSYKERKVRES